MQTSHNIAATHCAVPYGRRAHLLLLVLGITVLLTPPLSPAAMVPQKASPPVAPLDPAGAPPRPWIVDIAANEIRAIQHKDSFVRYNMHSRDSKGDRVRDVIESRDGTVARLILKDGHPLTEEEDKAERDRLVDMIASPSEFSKHVHNDATGKKLAVDLIQLMPDAMIYTWAPGQPQLDSLKGPHQLVIDYAPNPRWSPPNTTAEALTGLRGRMWIDPRTHQLLRMEGEVFQGVNFGWGMLAHIYPGGRLALDQVDIGGDRWIFSRFIEDVKVRALMLKTLNVNTTVEASGFRPLPSPLGYADAIRLLLDTPLPTSSPAHASLR